MAKTDFEIFNEMVTNGQDIVACPVFVRAQSDKRGGTISMGVPNPAFSDFALGNKKYIPILYLVNEEQFFALKEGES